MSFVHFSGGSETIDPEQRGAQLPDEDENEARRKKDSRTSDFIIVGFLLGLTLLLILNMN